MFLCQNYGTIHCIFNNKFIMDVIHNDKAAFFFCCLVNVSPVFPPIDCKEWPYCARKTTKYKHLSYVSALQQRNINNMQKQEVKT